MATVVASCASVVMRGRLSGGGGAAVSRETHNGDEHAARTHRTLRSFLWKTPANNLPALIPETAPDASRDTESPSHVTAAADLTKVRDARRGQAYFSADERQPDRQSEARPSSLHPRAHACRRSNAPGGAFAAHLNACIERRLTRETSGLNWQLHINISFTFVSRQRACSKAQSL
jgi:hypothetical protein